MITEHAPFTLFDQVLRPEEAANMRKLAEAYGPHGMYSDEGENEGIGEGKPQRFDSIINYLKAYEGLPEGAVDYGLLGGRANYFRETYAYGQQIKAPGIEPFLNNEGMIEAAKQIHGRPVIEPAIVFANLMVPGQELPCHTDVPEFRGANRKVTPQWLLVAMHHSGLFEDWRMPIATCVSWYHDADGGAFVFYPDGIDKPATTHNIRANSAVIIDTDSVFHGVGRMADDKHPIKKLRPGMKLTHQGADDWAVFNGDEVVDTYKWDEMRMSVSWKCYCFRDEVEQKMWATHQDDLKIDFILDVIEKDLRVKGLIEGDRPAPSDFADLIVAHYIKFPPPHPDLLPEAFPERAA